MTSTVFVHTLNGGKGKWSRYVFTGTIDAFSQLSGELFIRMGDTVVKVKEGLLTDYVAGTGDVAFGGLVQWPWVDLGTPGLSKKLRGFDLVASGNPSVSFGYDQTNPAKWTAAYMINPDTYPGGIIPMPLRAPSISMKIEFGAGVAWKLYGATLYLSESKGSP